LARAPGLRSAIVRGAVGLAYLLPLIIGSAATLDGPLLATALQVAPSAFLGFGFLALMAPLTAGGGNEVVPPDQLIAYPVRPATQFLGGLVLAPLNLVWVVQLLCLAAVTAYLTIGGSFLRGALATGSFVVAITVLGQAVAWTVVGLRQTSRGRRVVTAIGLLVLAAAVVTVRSGNGGAALDASPTRRVVLAVLSGGAGARRDWMVVTGVLVALAVVGLIAGSVACRWALGRPGDLGAHRRTEPVRRRSAKRGPLRALVAVDRASVWRAPALRRGGLVLVVLPGLLAAGAAVPWSSLVVLPGLVAAGAGLLFGVNAFCLDASGAVWLASLPHDPELALRAKAVVLTETVLGAVVIAAVFGSLRSPGAPTATELWAIAVSGLVCTAVVVSVALSSSVRRPHRADLLGPRDAVAPPGALALASVRLAGPTAVVGIVLGSASETGTWWLAPGLGLPLLGLCALSINRSLQLWQDPLQRARIVQVVAAG
ncbi:MAG: hypothetical protein H7233_07100, partial [Pseudorhodobacter sp.]|nr:hypothetical protein [Frankiaceae bacterium]